MVDESGSNSHFLHVVLSGKSVKLLAGRQDTKKLTLAYGKK